MSLSNVMLRILATVKRPPWYCNSIFVVERKACFFGFFFVSSMKMRVKSHPMIDWKDCVVLAATATLGGSSSSKNEDVGKPLLHLLFKALESVVDAPKAAADHSVWKMK